MAEHVRHFLYGEAYDDLRTAFFVDPRTYPNSEAAAVAVDSAYQALRKLRIIFEVEWLGVDAIPEHLAKPSWEDFKRRYFVDGEPLPVRGRPDRVAVPPAWEAMHEELRADHPRFRAQLVRFAEAALSESEVVIAYDRGPLRRSPGSVDWSEEKFGYEIYLDAAVSDMSIDEIRRNFERVLLAEGWCFAEPGDSTLLATRDHYEIEILAEPNRVFIAGKSPLYRALPEPATTWTTGPR